MRELQLIFSIGLSLIVVGSILVLMATISLVLSAAKSKGVKGGGVVMIGPFPIIFGTDERSVKQIAALAVILIVLVLALTVALALVGG